MRIPFIKSVKKEHIVTKSFNYQKDGVTLAFNLRVDNKSQLKPFEDLLVEALIEVREELEK